MNDRPTMWVTHPLCDGKGFLDANDVLYLKSPDTEGCVCDNGKVRVEAKWYCMMPTYKEGPCSPDNHRNHPGCHWAVPAGGDDE